MGQDLPLAKGDRCSSAPIVGSSERCTVRGLFVDNSDWKYHQEVLRNIKMGRNRSNEPSIGIESVAYLETELDRFHARWIFERIE